MNGKWNEAMNEGIDKISHYELSERRSLTLQQLATHNFQYSTTSTPNTMSKHRSELRIVFLRNFLDVLLFDDARREREWSTKPQFFNWKMMFIHPKCWWQHKKPEFETETHFFRWWCAQNRSEVEVFCEMQIWFKDKFLCNTISVWKLENGAMEKFRRIAWIKKYRENKQNIVFFGLERSSCWRDFERYRIIKENTNSLVFFCCSKPWGSSRSHTTRMKKRDEVDNFFCGWLFSLLLIWHVISFEDYRRRLISILFFRVISLFLAPKTTKKKPKKH